jgi:superfamily II DNA or RNA helicase
VNAPTLRPYQLEAIAGIRNAFTRDRATLLVLATGLGKTVTFAEIARRVVSRGRRVLVLAHRGELLEQSAVTLRRFGLTVSIEQGDQRADVLSLPDVVVASVQSLRGRRLASFPADSFALVVIDEAHHATAKSYRAILDHFATARVLGVTATPDRADGAGLGRVFRSVAHRVELAEGIAGGWLAPLELRTVFVDSLDLSKVRTVAGELHAGELEAELTRDRVLHEVAGPLSELSAGRQTIAFVAGVAQAHNLAAVLEGYGVAAAAVDGSMGPQERASVLEGYRSGRLGVVCNAMLWTEGFDAPETSCIALVRPTRSRSLIVQMIGRGTRLAPDKSSCLVLDFVPGTLARVRLAGPADALADGDLPEKVLARIRTASNASAGDLQALINAARAEHEAAAAAALEAQEAADQEQRRLVQQVGVIYAAPRMQLADLLRCMREPDRDPHGSEPLALPAQMIKLREAGFDVPETLALVDAHALFRVLEERREQGLCTLKQAKRLRSYGFRASARTASVTT